MKKIIFVIVIVVVSFLSSGCNFNSTYVNEIPEKDKAEEVSEKLYGYIKKKDYINVKKLFSEKFFKITSQEVLSNIFKKTKSDLGEYKTKKLVDWKTKRIIGKNPSTEYLLVYDVTYDSFNAKETIRLLKEGDDIKIIGYNINSEGFINIK